MRRILTVVAGTTLALALGACSGPSKPRGSSSTRPPRQTATTATSTTEAPPTTAAPSTTTTTAQVQAAPTTVPAGFAVTSASFVSPMDAFALGSGACATGPCTIVAASSDSGWSWHVAGEVPVPAGDLTTVRFATTSVGYAYGPTVIEQTTDGGAHWAGLPVPGPAGSRVDQLETSGGETFALTGPQGGAAQVYRAQAGSAAWATVPGATVADGYGAAIALGFGSGYLVGSGTLVDGPLAGGWVGRQDPCPAGLDLVEQVAAYAASSFYVACSGPGSAGHYQKAVYFSGDGGATFHPTGYGPGASPPSNGQLEYLAAVNDQAFMATSFASAQVYALQGASWKEVFGPVGDGQSFTDFGMTDSAQGMLVLNGALYLTRDGTATWTAADFQQTQLPPACQAGQLQVTQGQRGAGLGNTAAAFILHDTAGACSLYGYPGVTLTGPGGQALAVANRAPSSYLVQPRPELPVVLDATTPATFFLSDTDIPAGNQSCLIASGIEVYPPGSTRSITAPVSYSFCTIPPTTSFVVPGSQTFQD